MSYGNKTDTSGRAGSANSWTGTNPATTSVRRVSRPERHYTHTRSLDPRNVSPKSGHAGSDTEERGPTTRRLDALVTLGRPRLTRGSARPTRPDPAPRRGRVPDGSRRQGRVTTEWVPAVMGGLGPRVLHRVPLSVHTLPVLVYAF